MADIYSADETDFARELVGKSIKHVDEDRIALTDGTILDIEEGGSCCAWFHGTVREIDLDQNVITRVDRVDDDFGDDFGDEKWTINVYTAHKLIAAIDIEGNPTSGYYGSSINLTVRKAGERP